MPSARAATATAVNPGLPVRTRTECRRSERRLLILLMYEQPSKKFAPSVAGVLTLSGSRGHHRRDRAEYGADAAGNAGHNSSGCDGDKAGHQGIFDEILAAAIPPRPHQENKCLSTDH